MPNPESEYYRAQTYVQIRGQEQEGNEGNNIFNGFEKQLLEEVFGIDSKLERKLKNQNDNRGVIVKAQHDFEVVSPQSEEEGRGVYL